MEEKIGCVMGSIRLSGEKMKYTVTCYNGSPIFGLQIPFVRFEEVQVEVDADSESGAISLARGKVSRDYYEVIRIR